MQFFAVRSSESPVSPVSRRGKRAPRIRVARAASFATLVLVGLIACRDDDPVRPDAGVAAVEIVPASAYLEVGATASLAFVGHKADGTLLDRLTPKWTVSDPTTLTVTTSGTMTGVSPGSAIVTAALGARTATSTITVVATGNPAKTWGIDLQGLTEVSLLAVWAASPTSVFAGGQDGVIMRWTGGAWSLMSTPTQETIVGLWGSSETNVFAVGSNGLILHYDGTAWSPMPSGTTAALLDVWGLDATHVYATGASGAMLRYDGTQWSAMPNDAGPSEIWGIWGWSPTNLMAVGQNGALLRWDGVVWAEMATPVDVAGCLILCLLLTKSYP